jgi:7-carboxy-7-deazaguanine synthase (Cx14CxxC type)
MTYSVKEIFYTLQGEGFHSGRPAVFCRFTGCNLWSGREQDRAHAVCDFCDTDFVGTDGPGGGKFSDALSLALAIEAHWPNNQPLDQRPFVVCTGGEPALQLDSLLVNALHKLGFEIAIETNGTIELSEDIDWVCVSPKANAKLIINQGNELKLVYPQSQSKPEQFISLAFNYFYLQPMDGPEKEQNTRLAIDYCLQHPQWRLSLQSHKIIGIA